MTTPIQQPDAPDSHASRLEPAAHQPGRSAIRKVAAWVSALVLAAVFLAAALPKIAAPADFALAIHRYQLLPAQLVNVLAVYLPWLELVTAIGLLIPRLRRAAALLIAAMLVVFTIAIAINLYRGLDIACGCFTLAANARHMGAWNLLRNGILLALSLGLAQRPGRAQQG